MERATSRSSGSCSVGVNNSMTPQEQQVIDQIMPAAKAGQAQYGVPAPVTAAQCILESGWLKFMPQGSNNPFGIKAENRSDPNSYVEAMTTEYVGGQLEHVEQPFEKYPTLAAAFEDHARLIGTAPRYVPAMLWTNNIALFCSALQKCGYSTSPTYATQLLQIINEFGLAADDSN